MVVSVTCLCCRNSASSNMRWRWGTSQTEARRKQAPRSMTSRHMTSTNEAGMHGVACSSNRLVDVTNVHETTHRFRRMLPTCRAGFSIVYNRIFEVIGVGFWGITFGCFCRVLQIWANLEIWRWGADRWEPACLLQ